MIIYVVYIHAILVESRIPSVPSTKLSGHQGELGGTVPLGWAGMGYWEVQ
jgi:hypothetical protein